MIKNNLVKDRWKRKRQTRDEYLDKGKDNSQWQGGIRALCTTRHEEDRWGRWGEDFSEQYHIKGKAHFQQSV